MSKPGKPQVVITRKDKRLKKGWHLLALALTGGASAPVTAAKTATNAAYNARTSALAADEPTRPRTRGKVGKVGKVRKVRFTPEEREYFAAHVPASARKEARGIARE